MIKITTSFLLWVISNSISAQYLNDSYVTKLDIQKNETIVFSGDSLFIDTLQMRDGSTLKFVSDVSVVIRNAYFGNDVSIINSGIEGLKGKNGDKVLPDGTHGLDGTKGRDLTLVVSFNQLGSLLISTSGGNGGNGGKGFSPTKNVVNGERGYDGGDGGNPGKGSDAGDIALYYQSNEFIPVFNRRKGDHLITLNAKGGQCGRVGSGGRGGMGGDSEFVRVNAQYSYWIPGGEKGDNGISGNGCFDGEDGNITLRKLEQ